MEDNRFRIRHRTLLAGCIAFGGGAISCTVRNLSESGAALDVTSPIGIPDNFNLIYGPEDRNQRCRVVWRKLSRIGVTFSDDPPQTFQKRPSGSSGSETGAR